MSDPYSAELSPADYLTIQRALTATAKGRAFLELYAKHSREMETARLLRSIERLHRATAGEIRIAEQLSKELSAVLKQMTQARRQCPKGPLLELIEQAEASLMALAEVVDDTSESATIRLNGAWPQGHHANFDDANFDRDRYARLIGELSLLFFNDPNDISPTKQ